MAKVIFLGAQELKDICIKGKKRHLFKQSRYNVFRKKFSNENFISNE